MDKKYLKIAIMDVKNSGIELPIAFIVAPRVPFGIFLPIKIEASWNESHTFHIT